MSAFGTSIDEAYSMEGQLDPQTVLEGPQYDIFETPTPNNRKIEQQHIKPEIVAAQSPYDNNTNINTQTNTQTNTHPITNPVTQYPPYEYDTKSLQQELLRQNIEKQNQQVQHIKDIKTKKTEHFNGDTRKKSNDLYKSIIFTLMIVLAIATHYFIDFIYVHFVTASGKFSLREELGFRFLYPLIIFIIIWFAKS